MANYLPHTAESLDPHYIAGPAVERIRENIIPLARANEDNPAEKLSEWISALCAHYWTCAKESIAKLEKQAKKSLPAITALQLRAAEAREHFHTQLKHSLAARAEQNNRLEGNLKNAERRVYNLTIRLAGRSEADIPTPDEFTAAGVSAAVIMAVLTIEYFLNFGVIEFAADPTTSTLFSIGMSLTATLSAHIAAVTLKQLLHHRQIIREFEKNFPDNRNAEIAPLSAPEWTPFVCTLSHIVFIGICFTILGIRMAVVYGQGRPEGIIGSLVLIAILAAYYLYKMHTASPYHKQTLERYQTDRENLAMRQSRRTVTPDDPDIASLAHAYAAAIERIQTEVGAQLTALSTYARMVEEAETFAVWIDRHAASLLQLLGTHLENSAKKSLPETLAYKNTVPIIADQSFLSAVRNAIDNPPVIENREHLAAIINDLWPKAQKEAQQYSARKTIAGFDPLTQ